MGASQLEREMRFVRVIGGNARLRMADETAGDKGRRRESGRMEQRIVLLIFFEKYDAILPFAWKVNYFIVLGILQFWLPLSKLRFATADRRALFCSTIIAHGNHSNFCREILCCNSHGSDTCSLDRHNARSLKHRSAETRRESDGEWRALSNLRGG